MGDQKRHSPEQIITKRRDGDVSLAELANLLGYRNEAAFSRDVKRKAVISPGRARREGAEAA
jgi:AraC-like DNA-binding protein